MAQTSLPLFNWLTERAAGVFLHPSALPGDFGIGTLGREARHFVDFLGEADISYWQVCPLGPTSFGDSPYQGPSALAGNPYLIDVLALCEHGLIRQDALGPLLFLPQDRVDFGGIYKLKRPILRQAYNKFVSVKKLHQPYGDFAKFKENNASWLEPFALFQALKDHFGGRSWIEWPEEFATHSSAAKSSLRLTLAADIDAQRFYQYVFFGQWREMRDYARERGVSIIGDIPIFVALDSADVWANPSLFQFDTKEHQPRAVAGCPPDYFSADGQLWGNPLYDWDALSRDGYSWWLDRLRMSFELCDVLRIDHFRGFDSYWSIPAGSSTARIGEWKRGPGIAFFDTVQKAFPDAKIIAEDLGDINEDVRTLLKDSGLPGMAVLQFAFGGKADNYYLPHNLEANQVLYPGTHDNDTTRGWYHGAGIEVQDHVRRYLRVSGDDISWDFIRACYSAVSRLTVFPLQDLLNLDSRARFNTPGVAQGNWSWRYSTVKLDAFRRGGVSYLRELAAIYGRIPTS
ncbi:MAG TPA: 4-alpha-glucanotransferase [Opitutaceae bacterium]